MLSKVEILAAMTFERISWIKVKVKIDKGKSKVEIVG